MKYLLKKDIVTPLQSQPRILQQKSFLLIASIAFMLYLSVA